MNTTKLNNHWAHKMLTFHYLVVGARGNGCIYAHESIFSFHQKYLKNKIGYNTFLTLYKKAKEHGVIYNQGSTKRLISRNNLIVMFSLPFFNIVKSENKTYTTFRKMNYLLPYKYTKKLKYIELNNAIYEAILMFNISDQTKKINKEKQNEDIYLKLINDANYIADGREVKRIAKRAFKLGMTTKQYASRALNSIKKGPTTGTNHAAKTTQCSRSKANTMLRKLTHNGLITRYIVYTKLNNVTHYNFAQIAESNKGKHLCYNKAGQFYVIEGSKVNFTGIFNRKFPKLDNLSK